MHKPKKASSFIKEQIKFLCGPLLGAFFTGFIYLFFAFILWDLWPADEATQEFCGRGLRVFFFFFTLCGWGIVYNTEDAGMKAGGHVPPPKDPPPAQ